MSENLLEGTVKTPLGTYPKKTLAIVIGAVAVVGGIVYFRGKANATDPSLAGASEINPATGYPYGSAEDAAAMAAQAAYISPGGVGGGGGGGGSGGTGTPGRFTTNSEWSQYVITYMSDNDIVADVGPLSVALGKYLSGQPVTVEETSLIQQAIAIAEKPPNAGATGYPPSINTSAPVSPPPPTGGGGGAVPGPDTANVRGGWFVDQWILDFARQVQPGFTWDKFIKLNPQASSNIAWKTQHQDNRFKSDAVYRVK